MGGTVHIITLRNRIIAMIAAGIVNTITLNIMTIVITVVAMMWITMLEIIRSNQFMVIVIPTEAQMA